MNTTTTLRSRRTVLIGVLALPLLMLGMASPAQPALPLKPTLHAYVLDISQVIDGASWQGTGAISQGGTAYIYGGAGLSTAIQTHPGTTVSAQNAQLARAVNGSWYWKVSRYTFYHVTWVSSNTSTLTFTFTSGTQN